MKQSVMVVAGPRGVGKATAVATAVRDSRYTETQTSIMDIERQKTRGIEYPELPFDTSTLDGFLPFALFLFFNLNAIEEVPSCLRRPDTTKRSFQLRWFF